MVITPTWLRKSPHGGKPPEDGLTREFLERGDMEERMLLGIGGYSLNCNRLLKKSLTTIGGLQWETYMTLYSTILHDISGSHNVQLPMDLMLIKQILYSIIVSMLIHLQRMMYWIYQKMKMTDFFMGVNSKIVDGKVK